MPKPLRTWISNFSRNAWIVAIVSALGVIAVVWVAIVLLNQYLYPEPDFYSDVKNLDIETYSTSGPVKAVRDGSITITAGQVVTGKSGNELKYFEKTIVTDSNTQVFRRISPDRTDFVKADLSDIKPDLDITVYTSDNPYEMDSFKADRVEIN